MKNTTEEKREAIPNSVSRMLLAGKSAPLSAMSFLNPGISDPGKKAAVLCRDLFSFGNITASGFFEPKVNIPMEA